MKSPADRSNAETMFVRQGKTLEEIAAAIGVSKGTLARWSGEGTWVERRTEFLRQSREAPVAKLRDRRLALINAMDADPSVDQTAEDRLSKLQVLIEKMESRDAIGPTLDVMEKFARFVAIHGTDDSISVGLIREWTEKFLAETRKENT